MKNMSLRISERLLSEVCAGEECRISDTETKGLQLWIRARRMSWFVRKMSGGKAYTVKIGEYPAMRVLEARAKAMGVLGSLANHSALDIGRGVTPTVGEAIDGYVSGIANAGTRKNAETCFRKCIHLRSIGIDELSQEHTRRLHESLSRTPVHANRVIAYLKAAIRKSSRLSGVPVDSRCWNIRMNTETPRERFLGKEEAPAFLRAIDALKESARTMVSAYAIQMMLLTGARKTNVLRMEWSEIDGDTWTIPKGKFKTGRAIRIYLGRRELEILDRMKKIGGENTRYVFERNGKAMTDIRWTFRHALAIAGIDEKTTPHDLRRTLGTWMITNDTPIAVVSKKLGHSSIAVTERVYAHVMKDKSIEETDRAIDGLMGKQ